MKKQLLLTVVLISLTRIVWSEVVIDSSTGHKYQLYTNKLTWHNAKVACEKEGAHLATITSQGENEFIYNNVAQKNVDIWLGGTDEASEGNWKWVTGETWSYTDWSLSPYIQPSDGSAYGRGQDYLAYYSETTSGKWDDQGGPSNFNELRYFICEWDSTSSTPSTNPVCLLQPIGCGAGATFTVTPSSGTAPLTVQLNASLVNAPSGLSTGSIKDYQWTTTTGQTASGSTTFMTFTLPGTHTINLTNR